MEAAMNYREVAIPDANASGMAGTGHEYLCAAGTREVCTGEIPGNRDRRGMRPGFLCMVEPHRKTGSLARQTNAPGNGNPDECYGDPAFPLTGGLEPISVRLDKKIDRQGRRLLQMNERGRS